MHNKTARERTRLQQNGPARRHARRTDKASYHNECPSGALYQVAMLRVGWHDLLNRTRVKFTDIVTIDTRNNSFTVVALAGRKTVLKFDSFGRQWDRFNDLCRLRRILRE